jgi:hypothetical protein
VGIHGPLLSENESARRENGVIHGQNRISGSGTKEFLEPPFRCRAFAGDPSMFM